MPNSYLFCHEYIYFDKDADDKSCLCQHLWKWLWKCYNVVTHSSPFNWIWLTNFAMQNLKQVVRCSLHFLPWGKGKRLCTRTRSDLTHTRDHNYQSAFFDNLVCVELIQQLCCAVTLRIPCYAAIFWTCVRLRCQNCNFFWEVCDLFTLNWYQQTSRLTLSLSLSLSL